MAVTLPNLFQHYGVLTLLFPALGLVLAFTLRSRRWAVFVWMPTTLFWGYVAIFSVSKLTSFGTVRGPDAIGMGFAWLFMIALIGSAILGLVLCFFARPSKEAWRSRNTALAATLCVGTCALFYTPSGAFLAGRVSSLQIEFLGFEGKPIAPSQVDMQLYESGISAQRGRFNTNKDGRYSIQMREGQSAEISLYPQYQVISGKAVPSMGWRLNIEMPYKDGQYISVRHSWTRNLGGSYLNESFTEQIPVSDKVDLPIAIPPSYWLSPSPLREKIHAAILAKPKNFAYICRNVEASEFIPLLVESYRSDPSSQTNVIEGMSQIASILGSLNRACLKLQEQGTELRRYRHDEAAGTEFRNAATQFGAWAMTKDLEPLAALANARAQIAERTKQLTGFVLTEADTNASVIRTIEDLGEAGYSQVPEFIDSFKAHPPKSTLACQLWGQVLWRSIPFKEHFEHLKPLFMSHQPSVVLIACEAMGNQIGNVGPNILQQMEEARAGVQNNAEMQARLVGFISIVKGNQAWMQKNSIQPLN